VRRAVVDANVLVSGLISRTGAPAQLLRQLTEGSFELVVSPLVIEELRSALHRDKFRRYVTEQEADAFVAFLESAGLMADDPDLPGTAISRDPDDDYLIALAEQERAVLVTGDRHLLELAGSLPIYTPGAFLDLLDE